MPERLNLRAARQFEREVQPFLASDRPQVVLDLSQVRHLDAAGVDMLLRCMTQAMRRDGDVKLAALSEQAAAILELTRTDRLFEIFDNSTDAARSFTYFLPNAMRAFPGSFPAQSQAPAPGQSNDSGGALAA